MRVNLLMLVWVLVSGLFSSTGFSAPRLELYANFNTLGVIVHLDSRAQASSATVEYRASGDASFRQGQALSMVQAVTPPRLAGSLFDLSAGESYTVRVRLGGGSYSGTLLQASTSTRAESELNMPNGLTRRYVSPTGSGTACSPGQPCQLSVAMNNYARACNEIILASGTYYAGGFTIEDAATNANCPIVIRAADGASPVIHGAGQVLNGWSARAGYPGVYCTAVSASMFPNTTYDKVFNRFSMVLYQGRRLYPFLSLAELRDFTVSRGNADYDVDAPIPVPYDGFTVDGSNICVHLRSQQVPASGSVRLSLHHFGFRVRARYVQFRGLEFRYFGQFLRAMAIRLDPIGVDLDDQNAIPADYAVVSDNTFHVNDVGVGVGLKANRNVIQHNVFEELLVNEWPWDSIKLRDNLLSELEGGGVYFFADYSLPAVARGNVVRFNRFSGFFDGISICPLDDANKLDYIYLPGTSETDLHDNEIFNIGDDGVEADGFCANVRIWKNTFHDTVVAISVAPAFGGPVYLLRNLAYRFIARDINGNPGEFGPTIKLWASASWIAGADTAPDCAGYPTQAACIGPLFLYHNTIDASGICNRADRRCHHGFIMGLDRQYTQPVSITSRNNIFHGANQALFKRTTDALDSAISFDYDNLYRDSANELLEWVNLDFEGINGPGGYGSGCPVEYSTLASFRQCTGQELHGWSVIPGFQGNGNYQLRSTSPLIDRGVRLPGVNDRFAGSAPDIGYWERGLRPAGWIFGDGFED